MKRNRKKAETYRFNGHPSFHAHSIHSVTITKLKAQIITLEAKLADPNDEDDRKWTDRWLSRYKAELAKKSKGLLLKTVEISKPRFHRAEQPLVQTTGA